MDVAVEFIPGCVKVYDYILSVDVLGKYGIVLYGGNIDSRQCLSMNSFLTHTQIFLTPSALTKAAKKSEWIELMMHLPVP